MPLDYSNIRINSIILHLKKEKKKNFCMNRDLNSRFLSHMQALHLLDHPIKNEIQTRTSLEYGPRHTRRLTTVIHRYVSPWSLLIRGH